jgi:hypothetical protein
MCGVVFGRKGKGGLKAAALAAESVPRGPCHRVARRTLPLCPRSVASGAAVYAQYTCTVVPLAAAK